MNSEENSEDNMMLQRVLNAFNKRHARLNGDLDSTIDMLERLRHKIRVGEPTSRDLNAALELIVSAAVEGAELQSAVTEMLYDQFVHTRSIEQSYTDGWEARWLDLLGRATPEEAKILRALLIDPASDPTSDDNIPF